jgi:ribonuclease HI
MELAAAIGALDLVPLDSHLQLFTTSDYVFQGATRWINGWRKRNWQKKDGKPVANADLWQEIDRLSKRYKIAWINAKGQTHQGLDEAGKLAAEASRIEKESAD